MKPVVVIGFLGTQLDSAVGAGRWEKWRPTVSLGQHADFSPQRIELLVDLRRFGKLAQTVSADLQAVAPEIEVRLHDLHLSDPWDFEEVYSKLFDFAHAYAFAPEREDYLLHITTGSHVAQICLFLLAEARFMPARLLQTAPPRQQRNGRAGSHSIIDLDLARYDRIAQRFSAAASATVSFLKSGIKTLSPAFNQMIERIEHVASRTRAPLLLMGPTGAGKSQLARNLYQLKKQRQGLTGQLIEVNCATLRGDGAASALFGHVRGAYTGAQHARAGYLKSADGGMLFLDEIGELGLDEQAMLLRAIEDKRFAPLGSDTDISSDFQLIAGTNRHLAQLVASGRFREDLYARLNLWTFVLPGLKQRSEDIAPNLDFELERHAASQHQRVHFNQQARAKFLRFACSEAASWRGNFRDLGAAVTRMATLADSGRITEAVVFEEIERLQLLWSDIDAQPPQDEPLRVYLGDRLSQVDRFDRAQLSEVISVCRVSKSISAAGRALFDVSREQKSSRNDADRLRKYLARFGLRFEQLQVHGTP
jgi:transcriptional regulatory protein RtcR